MAWQCHGLRSFDKNPLYLGRVYDMQQTITCKLLFEVKSFLFD